MARFSVSPHAKDRAMERIPARDLAVFVEGVKIAAQRDMLCGRSWAVKVMKGHRVLGYAVGKGTVWVTTLSAGMIVRDSIVTIKV